MWGKRVLILLVILVSAGMGVREYKRSFGVWEKNRFNLVAVDKNDNGIEFLSYDPIEQKAITIEFPENLTINSRSVGEYSVGSLYKLGSYEGKGGEFTRRKVQGFMRIPIPGYIAGEGKLLTMLFKSIWQGEARESNLSRFDAAYLWWVIGKHTIVKTGEDELIRAGIISQREKGGGYRYSPERLEQYLGERFFDWKVGQEGATVAVVNMSGEDGLATDMARFLTNMGLDVIAVRSGNTVIDSTKISFDGENKQEAALVTLKKVFSFGEAVADSKVKEYRADLLIEVGKDALSLF